MEIELKLLLDPAEVAAFRRLALLRQHAIAKPRVQQLTGIYFDMPCHSPSTHPELIYYLCTNVRPVATT